MATNDSRETLKAEQPKRGLLGAHIRRVSAAVDRWPERMKPAYLKEAK